MPGQLDPLVEKLRKALGPDLVSVVLYGSAAAGEHDEKFSDYNVLCVLTRIEPAQLGATETIFRWWRQQGNPAPLLLTEHEVRTSTDCFAIEFQDIKEHHRILYGADVVSSLAIDRCFYRAQVEHDLRAKLLRLRTKASGILSDKDVLRRLLVDSISTFCVLFRHALILHGVDGPGAKAGNYRARAGKIRNRSGAVQHSSRSARAENQAEGYPVRGAVGGVHERDRQGNRRRRFPRKDLVTRLRRLPDENRIIVLIVVVLALVLGGCEFVSERNKLAVEKESIAGQWSQVDADLQRRADLIPNLVETVKGYAKEETTVFTILRMLVPRCWARSLRRKRSTPTTSSPGRWAGCW